MRKPEVVKPMTKTQFTVAFAERTGNTKKDAAAALVVLQELVAEQLKMSGTVTLPGIAKMVVKDKPATKAHEGINPFTKETITVKAKPASKTVRAVPVKAMKEVVA